MSNNFNFKNYVELLNKQYLSETDERQLCFIWSVIGRSDLLQPERRVFFFNKREYLAKKINLDIFRAKFLEMQTQDDDTVKSMEEDLEQLSNFSIDLKLETSPFFRLIDLIYDISMLSIEEGPTNGISEDTFRVSIEKAFSNPKLFK